MIGANKGGNSDLPTVLGGRSRRCWRPLRNSGIGLEDEVEGLFRAGAKSHALAVRASHNSRLWQVRFAARPVELRDGLNHLRNLVMIGGEEAWGTATGNH
jgi:hypothetical protein